MTAYTLLKLNLFLTSNSFLIGASIGQALGGLAGILNAFGLVFVFAGLIGAAVSAYQDRHVGGVKTSLVIAGIGGLAWTISQGMFAVGGAPVNNVTLQPVN
jgi:hypothetical protein